MKLTRPEYRSCATNESFPFYSKIYKCGFLALRKYGGYGLAILDTDMNIIGGLKGYIKYMRFNDTLLFIKHMKIDNKGMNMKLLITFLG